jgi:hypothetical protein
MRDHTADAYLLIANQLYDVHNALESKVLEHAKYAPKWDIDTIGAEQVIIELSPLKGLARLLERLATTAHTQDTSTTPISNDGN